ncbi:hypothetical protein [Kiloniella sp. EL199]|uniref:hypothetical protein n=1 Tax=Kiloniella sp. EL199 TaxID=2107581 RepID=UPI0013C4CF46|nr:hypothetical protein [Kiloniella sp. EL199]
MERDKGKSKKASSHSQQCCGGSPEHNTAACCKADEVAKEQGQKGCGCSCSSAENV